MKKQIALVYETQKLPKYLAIKKFIAGDIIITSYRYKAYNVFTPIIRSFFGLCLSLRKNNFLSYMRLRNYFGGFATEFSFTMFSKCILSIKKIKASKGFYVRSRLYYLRNRIAWQSTITLDTLSG